MPSKMKAAMRKMAEREGRRWKEVLRRMWETGDYGPYEDIKGDLQRAATAYGPNGLDQFPLHEG